MLPFRKAVKQNVAAVATLPSAPVFERTDAVPAAKTTPRLVSLDAFRGLTILGMLLVNNVALDRATPKTLTHADWSGRVHFADLVFPWFLFIVGAAIPFAYAGRKKRGEGYWRWANKAVTRAAALVLLGCFVDSTIVRQPIFGLGVLQIIGLAYLVGALLAGLSVPARLFVAAGLLALHWATIRFLPVPGLGAGVFTEPANAIAHINQTYLVPLGLKGLFSVVPTSALVLIGSAAGDTLRRNDWRAQRKLITLFGGGALLLPLGVLWSFDLPMNKPLWTAPYIVFAAGWAMIALGALYAIIDVWGWRRAALFLVVPGRNATLAYVVPILVKINVLQTWHVAPQTSDDSRLTVEQALQHAAFNQFGRVPGGWAYTLGYIAFWWLFLFYLYRRQIFVRT